MLSAREPMLWNCSSRFALGHLGRIAISLLVSEDSNFSILKNFLKAILLRSENYSTKIVDFKSQADACGKLAK